MNTHKYAGIAQAALLAFLTVSAGLVQTADATNQGYWVTKTAPIEKGADIANAAVVDGKIYTISGGSLTGTVKDTEMYDPQTNTWQTKTPMPTSRMYFASAAYNDKIYCIGGTTDVKDFVDFNEMYDTKTDNWTTKTPMPTPRSSLQANVVNGKIYLIGGETSTTNDPYGEAVNTNEVYDPQTDTWQTKTPIPKPTYGYASAVIGNKIYIIGAGLTQIYDTETNTWTNGTRCPQENVLSATATTTGQYAPVRIYIFGGGWGFFSAVYDKFTRIYDPANDSWRLGPSLPKLIGALAAVNINDTIYTVGGTVPVDIPDRIRNINMQYVPADYGIINTSTPSPTTAPSPTQTPPNNNSNLQTIWIITGAIVTCGVIGLTVGWAKKKKHAAS
jgi:N-acetylneuraminic acid mutarotase